MDGLKKSLEMDDMEADGVVSHEHAPTTKSRNKRDHNGSATSQTHRAPVLKRNFGFMAILGFSCTVLITWEATLITFETSIKNGGPAGMIYNYIWIWAGTASIFASLCELASMAPVAGGQYYWVSLLAPLEWQRFLSYVTGWLTLCGWQAFVASGSYISGTLIQALITFNHSEYNAKRWHGTLLFWAVYAFAVAINSLARFLLPRFEGLILVLHVLGFFGTILPMLMLGPRTDPKIVFTTFLNEGHWHTKGLSMMIGSLGPLFAFAGADAAMHMSEEIKNAPIVVPNSIMLSVFLNGAIGFGMILVTLFSMGNEITYILNSSTAYPFLDIFGHATGSTGAALTLGSIITIMQISATVGALASSSRILWSFARDRAIPGWRFFQKVDRRTSIPTRCIGLTTIISVLLSLINIASPVAFNDIVSLVIAGLYTSYLLVASLLLYRRLSHSIHDANSLTTDTVNVPGAELAWGPWHIPGVIGVVVNGFAVVFATVMVFFVFWPPERPVTAENMNYASFMTGAVVVLAVVYYVIWAKRSYRGPVAGRIETDMRNSESIEQRNQRLNRIHSELS